MTNHQLDTILDSIADGVFTIDCDFNITYFNRAAEKITGVSRKQAIGQKCFDVLRANICQISCALKATIDGGESRINLSGQYPEQRRKDDSHQYQYLRAS